MGAWLQLAPAAAGVQQAEPARAPCRYTMSAQRAKQAQKARKAAGDAGSEGGPNNVELQLQALGSSHVGYSTLQLGTHQLTVAGARPFSKVGG
jgi:hypothetical protein